MSEESQVDCPCGWNIQTESLLDMARLLQNIAKEEDFSNELQLNITSLISIIDSKPNQPQERSIKSTGKSKNK